MSAIVFAFAAFFASDTPFALAASSHALALSWLLTSSAGLKQRRRSCLITSGHVSTSPCLSGAFHRPTSSPSMKSGAQP